MSSVQHNILWKTEREHVASGLLLNWILKLCISSLRQYHHQSIGSRLQD